MKIIPIEGAQAGSQAQALTLEKGATTPLKKKVPNSDEQKNGSSEPTSTPLRSKNKQHLSNANSKTKIPSKLSARDHTDSLTKKSENKHKSKGNLETQSEPQNAQEHKMTFNCLRKCTEWYLVAKVGNSQVRIPASNCATQYTENDNELPILGDDILEQILKEEERLSCSQSVVTPLNRPPNAGISPNQPVNLNSSNNQSNGGYKRKENVKRAQKEYDDKFRMHLFEGKWLKTDEAFPGNYYQIIMDQKYHKRSNQQPRYNYEAVQMPVYYGQANYSLVYPVTYQQETQPQPQVQYELLDQYKEAELPQALPDEEKQSKREAIDHELAMKIADLLTQPASTEDSNQNAHPFLKTALPGEDQRYTPNSYILGGTRFMSAFTLALHLFQMIDTYDYWGYGQWQLIVISVGIMFCCGYSFALSTLENEAALSFMYKARYGFLILYWLVGGVMIIGTLVAAVAIRVSDHLAIYTISENVLMFSIVNLIPFTIMSGMTVFSYQTLRYQVNNVDRDYGNDHTDIFQYQSKDVQPDINQLTTQLVSSLLHDPAAKPRKSQHQPSNVNIINI